MTNPQPTDLTDVDYERIFPSEYDKFGHEFVFFVRENPHYNLYRIEARYQGHLFIRFSVIRKEIDADPRFSRLDYFRRSCLAWIKDNPPPVQQPDL